MKSTRLGVVSAGKEGLRTSSAVPEMMPKRTGAKDTGGSLPSWTSLFLVRKSILIPIVGPQIISGLIHGAIFVTSSKKASCWGHLTLMTLVSKRKYKEAIWGSFAEDGKLLMARAWQKKRIRAMEKRLLAEEKISIPKGKGIDSVKVEQPKSNSELRDLPLPEWPLTGSLATILVEERNKKRKSINPHSEEWSGLHLKQESFPTIPEYAA